MASITTIASSDGISPSRTVINTNFANLNSDKIETSVIDTDTTLSANSDAKIPSQKAVKAYVDANSAFSVSTETTTGATHSLTTNGSQRVLVIAKGNFTGSASEATITLKYNAVTKDTVFAREAGSSGSKLPFCLTYTETPASATQNIVVASDIGSIENVVITVMKFNV